MSKPVIGVTSAWSYETWGDCAEDRGYYYVGKPYIEAISRVGGLPMILAPSSDSKYIEGIAHILDGILFSGGGNARRFSPEELPSLKEQQEFRYGFEEKLLKRAYDLKIPILGICRGYQMIVEVFGGKLSKEIISGHKQTEPGYKSYHMISIERNSKLHKIIGQMEWNVNSIHIQEAVDIPEGFIVSARAEDDVIEGIESMDYPFLMGLQFHPEMLYKDEKAGLIFDTFVYEANKYRQRN